MTRRYILKNTAININELFDNDLDLTQRGLRKHLELAMREGDQERASDIYSVMRANATKKGDIVTRITEDYFSERGKMPDWSDLDRLGTWILRFMENIDGEELILTDRQMRRRQNDKEVLFYSPESREFNLEADGNKVVKKAPGMDSDESHKVRVRLPNDNADLRQFNGPLKKYYVELG
jgi:hypothetical protein